MDAYISPALLAYFLTGWAAVAADCRLSAVDAPAYVHRPGMRLLVTIIWPLFKFPSVTFFAIIFGIDYLIYSVVADYVETVFWRTAITGAIAFPLLAICSPIITIVSIPLMLVVSLIASPFTGLFRRKG